MTYPDDRGADGIGANCGVTAMAEIKVGGEYVVFDDGDHNDVTVIAVDGDTVRVEDKFGSWQCPASSLKTQEEFALDIFKDEFDMLVRDYKVGKKGPLEAFKLLRELMPMISDIIK